MKKLHEHYDKLTITEHQFVDEAFQQLVLLARSYGITLAKDDRAERAVDALARMVLESSPGLRLPWQVAIDGLEQLTPEQFKAITALPHD